MAEGPHLVRATEDSAAAVSAEKRQQMIAAAAYRRYEQRGGGPGDALTDWLQAEKEVDTALTGQTGEGAKAAFLGTIGALLGDCQRQLEMLGSHPRIANSALRRQYEAKAKIAAEKLETARARIIELRAHTDGAWDHLRDGAQKAAQELSRAAHELTSLLR
jgi:hypothetical protein